MSLLRDIVTAKKARIQERKRQQSWADLEGTPLYGATRRSMAEALRRSESIRFLTEIKRASPSAGWIRQDAAAVEIAVTYRDNGAAGISLLTEEEFFKGRLEDLPEVREIGLPVLMKDFIVDPYQVGLARAWGADALLLIAALDDPPLFDEVRSAARELGIEVLLEVHQERECEVAYRISPELVGVNNRDLATFEIDLATSERLRPRLPQGPVALSESGIRTREDVLRLEECDYDALLVGESLMRADDPGAELRRLRGADSEAEETP